MLLLRHAEAGERLASPRADRRRGLDPNGLRDAGGLPQLFAGQAIERIVSSPYARCLETVKLLAAEYSLKIERRSELLPDAARAQTLALLRELPDATLVCTHREVVERLFRGEVTCEKGGTWLLERRGRLWSPAAYFPPPTSAKRTRRRAALV